MSINKILNTRIKFLPKKYSFITAFLIAVFVYVFFLLFTPFDSADLVYNNHLTFITIPIIVFIVVFSFLHIFYKYDLIYFDKNNWTLKKQLIYIFLMLNCISILIFLFDYIFIHYFFVKYIFFKLFVYTFTVGIMPAILSMFWIKIFVDNNTTDSETDNKKKNNVINISSDDKKVPNLKIQINDFLYIKSENNYCKIMYLENQKIASKLFRLTLKNAERQLENHTDIIKCHRSYIVNKVRITKIEGNSKTAFIYLENFNHRIPISRSNFNKIKHLIEE